MYRAPRRQNRLCAHKEIRRERKFHTARLEAIRKRKPGGPSLDNAVPSVCKYKHLSANLKRQQLLEERFAEIDLENRILRRKMQTAKGEIVNSIMWSNSHPTRGTSVPQSSLNGSARRKELGRIARENQTMIQRILNRDATYSNKALARSRKDQERYINSIKEPAGDPTFTLPVLPTPPAMKATPRQKMSLNGRRRTKQIKDAEDLDESPAEDKPASSSSNSVPQPPYHTHALARFVSPEHRDVKPKETETRTAEISSTPKRKGSTTDTLLNLKNFSESQADKEKIEENDGPAAEALYDEYGGSDSSDSDDDAYSSDDAEHNDDQKEEKTEPQVVKIEKKEIELTLNMNVKVDLDAAAEMEKKTEPEPTAESSTSANAAASTLDM